MFRGPTVSSAPVATLRYTMINMHVRILYMKPKTCFFGLAIWTHSAALIKSLMGFLTSINSQKSPLAASADPEYFAWIPAVFLEQNNWIVLQYNQAELQVCGRVDVKVVRETEPLISHLYVFMILN